MDIRNEFSLGTEMYVAHLEVGRVDSFSFSGVWGTDVHRERAQITYLHAFTVCQMKLNLRNDAFDDMRHIGWCG